MTKKKIAIIFSSLASLVILGGCTRTVDETHTQGGYNTSVFAKNYLTGVNECSSASISKTTILDGTTNVFFGQKDTPTRHDVQDKTSHGGRYSTIFDYNGTALNDDIKGIEVKTYAGQDLSKYIGQDFGITKCLQTYDSSFSYGVFSRLYNGQTKCFGTGANGRVQIDKHGFTKKFPKTAVSGDYFLVSLRGATDIPYAPGEGTSVAIVSHETTVDLKLTLYKGNVGESFVMKNVVLLADGGGAGELVSYVGFKFSDFGYDFKGTDGFGISFELIDDSFPTFLPIENPDASIESANHFAVMLYETMFPDSSWN